MKDYRNDKAFAENMDEKDVLAKYRQQFHIPKQPNGEDCIYFCGNSLGLQPKSAKAYVEQELEDWAKLGVDGHFRAKSPWLPYHELLTEQTARLVGAKPIEVVVMNTLTVNLHLMFVSFYRPTKTKHKILIESNAFPSDQYAVQSHIKYHGLEPETSLVELRPRENESHLRTEDIVSYIEREGNSIALILLGGINYYSGQAFDLKAITKAGHAKDCIVGFDLAHAAGNIPLSLHNWDVDFAVWCSYKYLNGGPGCVAGCFVNERFSERSNLLRFAGWWGQNKKIRFQMGPNFDPIPGAEGWQISNPPILSMAALRASMEIFDEVGMAKLREKSVQLTGYLKYLLKDIPGNNIKILTPSDSSQRGCQLSILIKKNGKRLFEKLKERGIVCDWREPDVIRVAPVPLYNTFSEVYNFSKTFKEELQRFQRI